MNYLTNIYEVTVTFLLAGDNNLFTSGHDLEEMYDTDNQQRDSMIDRLKVTKRLLNVEKKYTYHVIFSAINLSNRPTRMLKIDGGEISTLSKAKFLVVIIVN